MSRCVVQAGRNYWSKDGWKGDIADAQIFQSEKAAGMIQILYPLARAGIVRYAPEKVEEIYLRSELDVLAGALGLPVGSSIGLMTARSLRLTRAVKHAITNHARGRKAGT